MFCVHKNVDTSNSNYIFSNGIYGVSPNTGNLPEKNWGGLLVFNTNGDSTCHASNAWIYQIYISHATQKMYLRMNINYTAAGWTAWKEH